MKKIKLAKRLIAISISLVMVLSNFTMLNHVAYAATPNLGSVVSKNDLLTNLKKYNKSDVKINTNYKNNGEFLISGILSDKKKPNEKEALTFLDQNKVMLGLGNVLSNYKQAKLTTDSAGYTHIKLNQYISGLPVKGRQVTIHFNKEGIITSATGNVGPVTTLTKLGSKNITANEAISIAKSQLNVTDNLIPTAPPGANLALKNTQELVKAPASVLDSAPIANKIALVIKNNVYEVYSINIRCTSPTIESWNIYVETSSGKVMDKQSNIRDADTPVIGTGIGVDGSSKQLNLDLVDGVNYRMKDLTKPMLNSNNIVTYTANYENGSNWYYYYSTTGNFNSAYDKPLVDAHYNAGVVYDFYKNIFKRDSIDGNGMTINSVAHLGYGYNNAFWDGSTMYYGDGDGTTFTYLSGDLDVVGHEMTHGVTQANGDLNYHGQSGALNESISDVFGVLIETYNKYNVKNAGEWKFNSADWVVGDDVYTPSIPGDALRSLANPTLYNQPDNMNSYNDMPDDKNDDYGGVHKNSGITNKAAYLIAQSIGMEKTAKIYYGAYNYFNYYIDFKGAANAIIQSATDMYGANSAEVDSVKTAFSTVNVIPVSVTPKVISTTPVSTATNVALNSGITVKFNEAVTVGDHYSGITVKDPSGTAISLSNSIDADTLTITPVNALASNTTYTVTIPAGAVIDGSGTALVSDYIFSFTTLDVGPFVTGISLGKTNVNLMAGARTSLIATITPVNASNKNVTWTSSNTSVATVDSVGNVTAVDYGTAVITVKTASGGYTASCTLSVDTDASKAIGNFVIRLYKQCLNREPDLNGLNFWKDKLWSKAYTGADIANSFIFSTEFVNQKVSDDVFVNTMYKTFFDRVGDSGGKAYWMDKLNTGISRLYVLSSFVNSTEFSNICTSYGISRGIINLTKPADLSPNITAFVYRTYDRCLERKPDDAGLNFWVNRLATGQSSGSDFANSFVFSPEFTGRKLSNNDFIRIMYRVFLNRDSDNGGMTYWVNNLNVGMTRIQVFNGFVNSQEFAAVCSNYGIKIR